MDVYDPHHLNFQLSEWTGFNKLKNHSSYGQRQYVCNCIIVVAVELALNKGERFFNSLKISSELFQCSHSLDMVKNPPLMSSMWTSLQ